MSDNFSTVSFWIYWQHIILQCHVPAPRVFVWDTLPSNFCYSQHLRGRSNSNTNCNKSAMDTHHLYILLHTTSYKTVLSQHICYDNFYSISSLYRFRQKRVTPYFILTKDNLLLRTAHETGLFWILAGTSMCEYAFRLYNARESAAVTTGNELHTTRQASR